MWAYFNAGISIQPHLLTLPVVTPNSNPSFYKNCPVSLFYSVGKGPSPTLVQYAFTTPITV